MVLASVQVSDFNLSHDHRLCGCSCDAWGNRSTATILDKTVEEIAYSGSIFLNNVAVCTDSSLSPFPPKQCFYVFKRSLIPGTQSWTKLLRKLHTWEAFF